MFETNIRPPPAGCPEKKGPRETDDPWPGIGMILHVPALVNAAFAGAVSGGLGGLITRVGRG